MAKVEAGGTVRLLPVKLGRNFGETVEIAEGLQGNEVLVLNPSDALAEGDKVQVVADAKQPAGVPGKAP